MVAYAATRGGTCRDRATSGVVQGVVHGEDGLRTGDLEDPGDHRLHSGQMDPATRRLRLQPGAEQHVEPGGVTELQPRAVDDQPRERPWRGSPPAVRATGRRCGDPAHPPVSRRRCGPAAAPRPEAGPTVRCRPSRGPCRLSLAAMARRAAHSHPTRRARTLRLPSHSPTPEHTAHKLDIYAQLRRTCDRRVRKRVGLVGTRTRHGRLWRRRTPQCTHWLRQPYAENHGGHHVTPARRIAYPDGDVDTPTGTHGAQQPDRGPRDSKDFPRSRRSTRWARSTPGPCRRPSSRGWSPSKRARTSTRTSATPSSNSTSHWSSSPPPASAPAASRWRTSSRSARSA